MELSKSIYATPKTHPIIENYVAVMRNEDILHNEFSYIPPEIPRFEHRLDGLNNGNSLMSLIYTMQAMLGYGDDFDDVRGGISWKGFRRILEISSLSEITKLNKNTRRSYNYSYL